MVAFNDAALTAKVNSFMAEFGGHPQLIRYGQFYLTNRLTDDLLAEIRSILQADFVLAAFPAAIDTAMAAFQAALAQGASAITSAAMLAIVDSLNLPAALRMLFAPTTVTQNQIAQLYNMVWDAPDIGALPPWLQGQPSIEKIKAASVYEADKCFPVLRALSRKLLRKRGVTTLPADARISDGQTAGANVQTLPAAGGIPGQQVIRHTNPAGLAAGYTRMRKALDRWGVVECGVLSGVRHERSAFPTPEHYVMAFAYGTLGGSEVFLAWDPDAGHSVIAESGWGSGITCLFPRPDGLATAYDASDLVEIDTAGDHLSHRLRHRYQTYYLQSLPL